MDERPRIRIGLGALPALTGIHLVALAGLIGRRAIATVALLVRATARHSRADLAADIAVGLGFVVAAVFLGVPTIAAIGAGALIGALALGRERPTSRETSVG